MFSLESGLPTVLLGTTLGGVDSEEGKYIMGAGGCLPRTHSCNPAGYTRENTILCCNTFNTHSFY